MGWEDDFQKELEERRQKKEDKRKQYLENVHDKTFKLNDGSFIYQCLVLMVCKRYELSIQDFELPDVAYAVVNHYFDSDVPVSFTDYLYCDAAPLVRPVKEVHRIFPEFSFLDKPQEVVDLANKIYNLNLEIVSDNPRYNINTYLFSPSFDFNSFTPICIDGIKELKEEIRVLKKYGHPTDELEAKLKDYGLSSEILELI